ncbi:MAG: sensor histidine kinase [Acidimicrobiia bacterium]
MDDTGRASGVSERIRTRHRHSCVVLAVVAAMATPSFIVWAHGPASGRNTFYEFALEIPACMLFAITVAVGSRTLQMRNRRRAPLALGLVVASLASAMLDWGASELFVAEGEHLGLARIAGLGLAYGLAGVVVAEVLELLRELGRSRTELAQRIEHTERLQQMLLEADEEVRRNVAEALHGPVQGRLLAAEMALCKIRDDGTLGSRELAVLIDALETIRSVRDEDVRQLSHLLHPIALDIGLVVAVRSLVAQMESMYNLDIDVSVDERIEAVDGPGRRGLPPSARLTLYRALEEAINNARKHGGARRLAVFLEYDGEDKLSLRVRDDGRGIAEGSTTGFGLTAIATRAGTRGGSVDIGLADGVTELRAAVRVRRQDFAPMSPDAADQGAPPTPNDRRHRAAE